MELIQLPVAPLVLKYGIHLLPRTGRLKGSERGRGSGIEGEGDRKPV
jgi:hypothetical protein